MWTHARTHVDTRIYTCGHVHEHMWTHALVNVGLAASVNAAGDVVLLDLLPVRRQAMYKRCMTFVNSTRVAHGAWPWKN